MGFDIGVFSDEQIAAFRADFIAEVLKLPNELDALLAAIEGGRMNGAVYTGECPCLAGTLARAGGVTLRSFNNDHIRVSKDLAFGIDRESPRERWFLSIEPGDTPETNQFSEYAREWTNEARAIRDHVRATAKKTVKQELDLTEVRAVSAEMNAVAAQKRREAEAYGFFHQIEERDSGNAIADKCEAYSNTLAALIAHYEST